MPDDYRCGQLIVIYTPSAKVKLRVERQGGEPKKEDERIALNELRTAITVYEGQAYGPPVAYPAPEPPADSET